MRDSLGDTGMNSEMELEWRINMLETELEKLKKIVRDRHKNQDPKMASPKILSNEQYREALRLAEYREQTQSVEDEPDNFSIQKASR